MDRKKNRSDKYQFLIVESVCSPEILIEVADADGMTSMYSPHNEELLDLRDALKAEFWRLVDTQLTERQCQVVYLYAKEKLTQIEIAKRLNVNQSSITKSLNGNCDYRNGKKVYGGALKKLKRLAEKDDKIRGILRKIAEITED